MSIIIPAYNEAETIHLILNKIKSVDLTNNIKKEIIIVNDCSTDNTETAVKSYIEANTDINIQYYIQPENMGKGAALHRGIREASGEAIIIQDADLEYDPNDYKLMLSIMESKRIKCLYGSRVLNKERYKQSNFLSAFRIFANHVLTIFTNLIYGQKLTDAHTCYKMVEASLIKSLKLRENRFSFCPELTSKISKKGIKIQECSINYIGIQ